MKSIRLLVIAMLRAITSIVQVKGVPKVIIWMKGTLFRKDEPYNAYRNIKICLDPTVGFHCLNVLNHGGYEVVKTFEKFLSPGDVYIDIGANLGFMSLNAEKIVGPTGKVISFEPDPKILPILKNNISINNSAILLVEKAVCDKEGTEVFNIATESGLSRLDNKQQNLFGMELSEKVTVETNTLDNFLAELLPNRPIQFIKIDVEGHELRILRGADSTLKKYRPTLFLEINHGALRQNNVSFADILDHMKQYSYECYFVNSHGADWFRLGRRPTYRRIADDHHLYLNRPLDLLCVHSEVEQGTKWQTH